MTVDASGERSLATAVLLAQNFNNSLRDFGELRDAALNLIEQATRLNCLRLMPSSSEAERLVTAASILSEGRLRIDEVPYDLEPGVLVVDAAVVTGAAVRELAASVKAGGTRWVGVIVMRRLRPDLDRFDTDPYIDEVVDLASKV